MKDGIKSVTTFTMAILAVQPFFLLGLFCCTLQMSVQLLIQKEQAFVMKFAFVCARVPCLLLLSRRAAGTKNCVERGLDKTPRSAHSARCTRRRRNHF